MEPGDDPRVRRLLRADAECTPFRPRPSWTGYTSGARRIRARRLAWWWVRVDRVRPDLPGDS